MGTRGDDPKSPSLSPIARTAQSTDDSALLDDLEEEALELQTQGVRGGDSTCALYPDALARGSGKSGAPKDRSDQWASPEAQRRGLEDARGTAAAAETALGWARRAEAAAHAEAEMERCNAAAARAEAASSATSLDHARAEVAAACATATAAAVDLAAAADDGARLRELLVAAAACELELTRVMSTLRDDLALRDNLAVTRDEALAAATAELVAVKRRLAAAAEVLEVSERELAAHRGEEKRLCEELKKRQGQEEQLRQSLEEKEGELERRRQEEARLCGELTANREEGAALYKEVQRQREEEAQVYREKEERLCGELQGHREEQERLRRSLKERERELCAVRLAGGTAAAVVAAAAATAATAAETLQQPPQWPRGSQMQSAMEVSVTSARAIIRTPDNSHGAELVVSYGTKGAVAAVAEARLERVATALEAATRRLEDTRGEAAAEKQDLHEWKEQQSAAVILPETLYKPLNSEL